MVKKMASWMAVILIFGVAFSCKVKTQMKGIDLKIVFSDEELSEYLMTDVEYTWTTSGEFEPMDQGLNVFVHFWHRNNLLVQDDHVPEVPTSSWEPEKEYRYTRRILIPSFIDEFDPAFKGQETLRLTVGFYSPFDRSGESKRDVFEKTFDVRPKPADTPEIVYEDGWSYVERNPEAELKEWRWTGKSARCLIDNPRRDALLVIQGAVNKDVFDDQRVIFKINDRVLDDFVPEEKYFDKSFDIEKEMLGDADLLTLWIETDKTFVPANIDPQSQDDRELGLVVSLIYFR